MMLPTSLTNFSTAAAPRQHGAVQQRGKGRGAAAVVVPVDNSRPMASARSAPPPLRIVRTTTFGADPAGNREDGPAPGDGHTSRTARRRVTYRCVALRACYPSPALGGDGVLAPFSAENGRNRIASCFASCFLFIRLFRPPCQNLLQPPPSSTRTAASPTKGRTASRRAGGASSATSPAAREELVLTQGVGALDAELDGLLAAVAAERNPSRRMQQQHRSVAHSNRGGGGVSHHLSSSAYAAPLAAYLPQQLASSASISKGGFDQPRRRATSTRRFVDGSLSDDGAQLFDDRSPPAHVSADALLPGSAAAEGVHVAVTSGTPNSPLSPLSPPRPPPAAGTTAGQPMCHGAGRSAGGGSSVPSSAGAGTTAAAGPGPPSFAEAGGGGVVLTAPASLFGADAGGSAGSAAAGHRPTLS